MEEERDKGGGGGGGGGGFDCGGDKGSGRMNRAEYFVQNIVFRV